MPEIPRHRRQTDACGIETQRRDMAIPGIFSMSLWQKDTARVGRPSDQCLGYPDMRYALSEIFPHS